MRLPPATAPAVLRAARGAGFTLLEVLVAVTIFAVCMTALYNSFRVATRSFESGRQSAEVMQSLRFSLDLITRDLRGIYYDPQQSRKTRALEQLILQNQDQIIRDQGEGKPAVIPGLTSGKPAGPGGETVIGLRAKVRFIGGDNGEVDTLEFCRYRPSDGTFDNSYLGVERLRYFVFENNLYRQRSRAFRVLELNPRLADELVQERESLEQGRDAAAGNPAQPFIDFKSLSRVGVLPPQFQPEREIQFFVEAANPAEPAELIARHVTSFDISYLYFNDGAWQETASWDSDKKQHRTPPFELGRADPFFLAKLTAYQQRDTDHLPTALRLRLRIDPRTAPELRDKPNAPRTGARSLETTIWIPSAIETARPGDLGFFKPTALDEQGRPIAVPPPVAGGRHF